MIIVFTQILGFKKKSVTFLKFVYTKVIQENWYPTNNDVSTVLEKKHSKLFIISRP